MQIVRELPSGTNGNFDVHWYPKVPGVISASSFDGKIGLYNIEVCIQSLDQQLKTTCSVAMYTRIISALAIVGIKDVDYLKC